MLEGGGAGFCVGFVCCAGEALWERDWGVREAACLRLVQTLGGVSFARENVLIWLNVLLRLAGHCCGSVVGCVC